MKNTMWKTTIREIKQSLGRYLAVMAIIVLGVGMFAGLILTTPYILDTANEYLNEKELFDFRLISTYGFEEEDVEYLAGQEDARYVEGAYAYDVLIWDEAAQNTMVMKIHSITENVNQLELLAGRMPENANECVADASVFGEDAIGQTLYITEENEENTLDAFAVKDYTITGIVNSSLYIQFERGNTSVGDGQIGGFLYVMEEAFDSDIYTEIYVKLDHDFEIYSDAYEQYIEEQEIAWEEYLEITTKDRFERAKIDAVTELADAKEEFETEKADGETELADAKQQLDDAYEELQDAKQQLADGKRELADGKQKIEDGKQAIIDGWQEIEDGRQEIEDGYAEIEKNQKELEEGEAQLKSGKATLEESEQELNAAIAELEKTQSQITPRLNEVKAQEAALNQREAEMLALEDEIIALELRLENGDIPIVDMADALSTISSGRVQITQEKSAIAAERAEISAAYVILEPLQEQIDAGWAEINSGKAQLAEAKAQMQQAEQEIASGKKQLAQGISDLQKAEAELEKGEQELKDYEAELADAENEMAKSEIELADAEKELEDGEAEYQDGLKEYEDGLATFKREIADAQAKIADAEEQIENLEDPEWYLLGRNTNIGYVCLENDSQIVADIAAVLPVFFFLIAALVCMTTMNRMVEEQRTQIGVLKALGYSNSTIMGKYLFYSGSAAGLGSILGFFVGTYVLPKIVWMTYGIMYDMPDLNYYVDWKMFVISMFFSLLCSMGTTWFSCHTELAEVAATLMRPKAPKAGKRVFLEYVPFIWKHLSFLVKVSIRNVFRYKKRFFMMIVGISGCTALLVTGFGIKDSIADITSIQYDEILLYDMSLSLREEADEEALDELTALTDGNITEMDFFMEGSLDLTVDGTTKALYVIVPENLETFENFIDLHTLDEEPISYPGTGEAVISHKIADTFGIKIGDTVQLSDDEHNTFEVTISGINKNFINNYIFLNEETCTTLWKAPEYKTVYINVPEENDEMYQLSASLMDMENTASITITKDSEERFKIMMSSLDYIVMLVIVCAAALAFIVLYNLTNINIMERIREIATIKVLGFYKNETATYVFRENIALTAIGAFIGLLLGKIFHSYVMSCIKIDIVAFDVRVKPISYVYSIVLTFVFAWIVNRFMSGKLEKISMTESLKSVD